MLLGMLLVMKALKGEWYIVVKASMFTGFEVLSYTVCLGYPCIYGLTDSMILFVLHALYCEYLNTFSTEL